MTREKIMKLRELILKAAASLDDDDAYYCPEFFEDWKPDMDYAVGVRLRYGGKLYRVEQAHRSQAGWTPDIVPALYTEVPEPGQILPWKQPTGAQDAYRVGAKVSHKGKIWLNWYDYNTFEPGVYGWDEVTE